MTRRERSLVESDRVDISFFFFSSRRRHTRFKCDWSSDVCSSDLMKRAIDTTMESGAKGIRIQMAGRLGGAEMARTEKNMAGSNPLSTICARTEYSLSRGKNAHSHIVVEGGGKNGGDLNEVKNNHPPARAR